MSLIVNMQAGILYSFFPKADTSGCTKEAIAFSALETEFEAANAVVIGMSKDTTETGKIQRKTWTDLSVGADHETDICEQFGVWVEKSMYGLI